MRDKTHDHFRTRFVADDPERSVRVLARRLANAPNDCHSPGRAIEYVRTPGMRTRELDALAIQLIDRPQLDRAIG